MWADTFNMIAQDKRSFFARLLNNQIELVDKEKKRISSSVVDRASSLLAARLSLFRGPGERRRLLFVVPSASQSLAMLLTINLLLADSVHKSPAYCPIAKTIPIIDGDILLVTQNIRECVKMLREVSVGPELISKHRSIQVLSQHSTPGNYNEPRVFIANPGWLSFKDVGKRFFTVIVDASHPRTLDNIENLLINPNIKFSVIQLFIIPPLESERMEWFLKDKNTNSYIWVWDPETTYSLQRKLSEPSKNYPAERSIWLTEDYMINMNFTKLHSLLTEAMKLCNGNAPKEILEIWSIYHRLRQLSVPLLLLEEEQQHQKYRPLTIDDRIKILETNKPDVDGALSVYLDANWLSLVYLVRKIYKTFIEYVDPAKFYTLAYLINHLLESNIPIPIRIVAPTRHECNILTERLGEIIDSWGDAIENGIITFSTIREEQQLVSKGNNCSTIILGFRTSRYRYLDIYPQMPLYMIAYPYEAEIDAIIQNNMYTSIEKFESSILRNNLFEALHLPIQAFSDKICQRAATIIYDDAGKRSNITKRFILNAEDIDPISVENLSRLSWTDDIVYDSSRERYSNNINSIQYVEVVVTDGERIRYPSNHLIDIFYFATGLRERKMARDIKPGMSIIVLVDDPYETIFMRLLEVMAEQRDPEATIALELWKYAKRVALKKAGGSRKKLYKILCERGLSVDYPAVVSWYAPGEEEIVAPLKETDFEVLAHFSGVYKEITHIKRTYKHIHKERILHRRYSKRLIRLVYQIAIGNNYEVAIETSKILNTPLEQIAAAISIKQVEDVRLVEQ